MKDYERKYKQALIRATREFDCAQTDSTKNVIQTIFPELLESEDEKIRKALMQNLKERFGTKGNMGEGLDMPDVLTWLEKQKPADKAEPKFQKMKEAGYEWDSEKKELKKFSIESTIQSTEVQHKPTEWSEEDDQYLLVCKNALAKYQVSDKWDATIISRWLESLKDRVLPKQEWK